MLLILVPALLLCLAMSAAWALRQKGAASGWIDVIWSASVGVTALSTIFAVGGDSDRKAVIAGMVIVWSARLAAHIALRARSTSDDPRYVALEAEWGASAPRRLLMFLQIQAVAGLVLVVSLAIAAANPSPFPNIFDCLGAPVFVAGWIGETLADAQLRAFSRTEKNNRAVCEVGLWRWSRHPNYVFEWLIWCAPAIVALARINSYPLGIIALAAPAMMYALLARISGVPPLEAHMLKSRGEVYRDYQRRVPAFFPLLKRARKTSSETGGGQA